MDRRTNYTPAESQANWQPRSSGQVRPNFPFFYPSSSNIYCLFVSLLSIDYFILSFILEWLSLSLTYRGILFIVHIRKQYNERNVKNLDSIS